MNNFTVAFPSNSMSYYKILDIQLRSFKPPIPKICHLIWTLNNHAMITCFEKWKIFFFKSYMVAAKGTPNGKR